MPSIRELECWAQKQKLDVVALSILLRDLNEANTNPQRKALAQVIMGHYADRLMIELLRWELELSELQQPAGDAALHSSPTT